MVGYIGDFEVVKIVVEMVDKSLRCFIEKVQEYNYEVIVIVDYGNFDFMVNVDGLLYIVYIINLVLVFYIVVDMYGCKVRDGKLGDIGFIILEILGMDVFEDMDGESLFV